MNEIKLSDNLQQIELEIQHHKNIAGQSIWEIGRRLNHVKENDLAHGQFGKWLEKIDFSHYVANQFMKVAKELPNYSTSNNLGINALYLIATLPEEEREKEHTLEGGETKKADEMTVRELQELKKQLKEKDTQLEQAKRSEQIAIDKLEEEQNKEPEVIEKEIEIERIPDDYDYYKSNYEATKSNYEFYKKQNEELRNEMKELERRIADDSADDEEVERLKKDLKEANDKMVSRDKEYRRLDNFKKDTEEFIHKYAPMKYFNDFDEVLRDRQAFGELEETLDVLEKWIKETKEELPNQIIIEGEN